MTTLWMQTASGKRIDPMNPDPSQINIEDIAHSLSNLCRFNGHTKDFYSVAQHSLYVAKWFEDSGYTINQCLIALLHDAHEAYLGDLTRPLKRHDAMRDYCNACDTLQAVIYSALDINVTQDDQFWADLDCIDTDLAYIEGMQLLGNPVWAMAEWGLPVPGWSQSIIPCSPKAARDVFLTKYDRYMRTR